MATLQEEATRAKDRAGGGGVRERELEQLRAEVRDEVERRRKVAGWGCLD